MNQNRENETMFSRKRRVPGTVSYSENLIDVSGKDNRNIKIFYDSIPKRIGIKELNQHINNGNAWLFRFPGATLKQLPHHLDVNIDYNTVSVLIHVGSNNILNSDSSISRLLLNIKRFIET